MREKKDLIIAQGISFIEILVVIAIFAIMGVLIGRITLITLRGANKSDSLVKVRENLDYSLSIMERHIRNAETVNPCPNPVTNRVDYTDTEGKATSFSCVGVGGADAYIASGSARITTNDIKITSCTISCSPAAGRTPPSVNISLEATEANRLGIESARVTAITKIFLRTY